MNSPSRKALACPSIVTNNLEWVVFFHSWWQREAFHPSPGDFSDFSGNFVNLIRYQSPLDHDKKFAPGHKFEKNSSIICGLGALRDLSSSSQSIKPGIRRQVPTAELKYDTVKKGKRPVISKETRNSNDPANQILNEAMHMCHVQDQYERARARQVETFLIGELLSIDPYARKSWGL